MTARWNSSRAPESPLSRIRSKPWCVFKCAKRISTRFRSSRDLVNAFVFIFRRAIARASSWISRGILRGDLLVTQGGNECCRHPMAVGHRREKALTTGRPAIEPDHICLCSRFIKEDKTFRVQIGLARAPLLAGFGDIRKGVAKAKDWDVLCFQARPMPRWCAGSFRLRAVAHRGEVQDLPLVISRDRKDPMIEPADDCAIAKV